VSGEGEEVKGIRQRLLEVYCYLYFDPDPELGSDAKAQVNRIAKNLIE
jgi:condensin complex subunit 1